ncbi:MAG: hypothetical protein JO002_00515 [Burkholderiaceae bacterium]|nr:hypothetical protein [Burkholderiaceae bacterium]
MNRVVERAHFRMDGIESLIVDPVAKAWAYAIVGGLIAILLLSPAFFMIFASKQIEEIDQAAHEAQVGGGAARK